MQAINLYILIGSILCFNWGLAIAEVESIPNSTQDSEVASVFTEEVTSPPRSVANHEAQPRPSDIPWISFASNSARLKLDPRGASSLNNLAEVLKLNPQMSITIEVHTDTKGSPQSNKLLSLRRAESVRKYLQGLGVTNNMAIVGWGGERPISTDDRVNSRVVFIKNK